MNGSEVKNQIDELEKIRAQSRLWRTLTVLALLAIVVIGVGSIVSAVRGLFSPGATQEEFAGALSSNLQRDVVPQVQSIAQQAIAEIRPQVESELSKLNDRVPELTEASMKQFELLQKNVPDQAEKVLEETLGAALIKKEPKIRAMFPEVTEAKIETAVHNVSLEATERIMHAHDSLFAAHMTALNNIIGNLDKIQRSERVNPKDEKADWEMGMAIFDLVHDELKNLQPDSMKAKGKTTVAPRAGAPKPGMAKMNPAQLKAAQMNAAKMNAAKMNAAKMNGMKPNLAKPNAAKPGMPKPNTAMQPKGASNGTKQPVGY